MTAAILSFGRRNAQSVPLPSKMPWQNQDLAELYRVRDRLCAAGLDVEVEGGVTDEGDPWFIYQQSGTDNVVVHIARIDDEIHVINCVTGSTYVGKSFREVSDRMLEDAPLALGNRLHRSSNVVLHPSAFLTAFVAAAIMLVDLIQHGRAEAAEGVDTPDAAHSPEHGAHPLPVDGDGHHGPATHDAAAEAAEASLDEGDGTVHRRLGKEGPASASGASSQGAVVQASAPVQAAGGGHGGFLVDVPGSGSSFALTAGMFAAELLRVFASEDRAEQGGSGFASDFSALFTAFVSSDAAQIKAPAVAAGDGANFTLAAGAAGIGGSDPAVSARIDAPSLSGEGLAHAFSVKAAAQALPEGVVFPAPELHAPALLPDRTAPMPVAAALAPAFSPAAPPSSSSGAETAHTTEAATPTSAPAPTPVSAAASTPASPAAPIASTAVSTAPVAAASVVAPVKEAAADVIDLGWVVSQLVKRSTLALDTTLKLAASTATDAAAKTGTALVADTKADGAGTPLAAGSADKSDKSDKVGTVEKAVSPVVSLETGAAKTAETSAAKTAAPSLVPAVDLHIGNDGLLGRLVAGRAETVHYATGSNLTVEGFVFGEDVLSFAEGAGDRLATKAHQDGNDLVLGDVETGSVRLVGVLVDPLVLTHHNAATSAS